ncbi:hypothetical protein AC1031_010601 [Aphanomyces cochlioides]|nr:hypothetical protein AC1031_010601 [Aphanomyces cochlioides]
MTFRDSEFIKRFEAPASESKVWEVQEIIENPVFWSQAMHVLRLTQPISKSLSALEQDDCSASLVYETFMGMMNHHAYNSGGDLELAVLDTINRRWNDFHSKNMLAAYLLGPTKSMSNFMVGDKLRAIDAVPEIAASTGLSDGQLENLYNELERFVIEKDRWGPTELANNAKKSPTTWWISRDYSLERYYSRMNDAEQHQG